MKPGDLLNFTGNALFKEKVKPGHAVYGWPCIADDSIAAIICLSEPPIAFVVATDTSEISLSKDQNSKELPNRLKLVLEAYNAIFKRRLH